MLVHQKQKTAFVRCIFALQVSADGNWMHLLFQSRLQAKKVTVGCVSVQTELMYIPFEEIGDFIIVGSFTVVPISICGERKCTILSFHLAIWHLAILCFSTRP